MQLGGQNGEGNLHRLYWEVWGALASLRKEDGPELGLDEHPAEASGHIQLDHRGLLFWAPWAPYEAYPALLLSRKGEIIALHLLLDFMVLNNRGGSPRVDAVIEGVTLGHWKRDLKGLDFRVEWAMVRPNSFILKEVPYELSQLLIRLFGIFLSLGSGPFSLCIGGRSVNLLPTHFPFPHIEGLGERLVALGLPRLRPMTNAPYAQLSWPLWATITLGGDELVWPITLKRLLHISEVPKEVAALSNVTDAQGP